MKLLNLLTPKFFKSLDDYFLLHNRLLWITKLHYVLYYGFITAVGGSALIWAYPLHTDSSLPEIGFVLFLSSLLGLPALIFWLYKQSIYSIEKNYGNLFPFMEQLRFGVYLLCFAVFVGLPVYFTILVEQKVADLESNEQLAKDAYALNAGNPYFPSHQNNDIIWEEDKALIKNWHDQNQFPEMTEGRNYYNFMPFYVDYYFKHDTYRNNDQLTFRNLFINTNTEAQKLALIENFITANNKYSNDKIDILPQEALASYMAHKISYHFSDSYKYHISSRLSAISRSQNDPLTREDGLGITVFSVIFCFATLLTIFQNVKWQDFVAAASLFVICSFVYGGLLSFISAMTSQNSEIVVFSGILLAFAFFLFKGYQTNNLQVFSRFKIFALMFANVMSPFMLLLLASWAGKITSNYHISGDDAKIFLTVGMLIHGVIFIPFFRKMYLKMRALPRV